MNKFDVLDRDNAYLNIELAKIKKILKKAYLESSEKMMNEILVLYDKILFDKNVLVSDLYRYNRLFKLNQSINEELNKLGFYQEKKIEESLVQMYIENSFAIGKSYGFISEIRPEIALEVVNSIWCKDGLMWKDRVWQKNIDLLREDLVKGLINVASMGGSQEDLKFQLMKDFNISYNKATRLVRTELKHIMVKSAIDEYKREGRTRYEYLTAEDDEVCQKYGIGGEPLYCRNLDRKLFPIDDIEHLPPQHPNCRCSVMPVID